MEPIQWKVTICTRRRDGLRGFCGVLKEQWYPENRESIKELAIIHHLKNW